MKVRPRLSVARAHALAVFASSLAWVGTAASAAPLPPHAVELDLPLAGLRVVADLPLDTRWSVRSRWDADRGEDVVTLAHVDEAPTSYAIELAGRTGRDCALSAPFPIELGGETWIHGRAGAPGLDAAAIDSDGVILCRLLRDARALVRITRPGGAQPAKGLLDPAELETHARLLRPLLDALRTRRLIPGGPPPLPPPEQPLPPELGLPIAGLTLTRPDDHMLWRVAATGDRDFDALIRVLPVFPEVQVAVRRHALSDVPGCARLTRYLIDASWSASATLPPPGWSGILRKRSAGFESVALCREHADALIDARIAARPETPASAFARLLDALAASRVVHPPPPSALPHAASRAVLLRTAALALGADFPGTVNRGAQIDARSTRARPFASLDLGVSWASRNGLALAAAISLGADARGALLAATLETGVALALDPELTFVLGVALDERREALFANRSLSLVVDMRAGEHEPGRFAWSLRIVPLHLASREPAISGLPLAISWTGLFTSGLLIGVDLRWVSTPLRASETWPSEGLALGLRIGLGSFHR